MRHIVAILIAILVFNHQSIVCNKGEMYKPDVEIFIPDKNPIVEEEVLIEVEEEIIVEINQRELELLAHLIFAEAGSDWCEDNMLYYVGSVVLNRIESEYYPNTMEEVIYQPGQYSCVNNGHIEFEYNQRAYNVAEDLLTSGSCLPSNVVYQAQFEQGDGVYVKVQHMYFCYKGELECRN